MLAHEADLVDAVYAVRARQALLVHMLRQMGGEVILSPLDVFESAKYDVRLQALPDGVKAKLEPCRA